MSPFKAGAIALVLVLIGCYLGFTKDIPFTQPFTVNAVFNSANSLRKGSLVRIAGVNVGKVKAVKPEGDANAAVVVLQIDQRGLPIHADATAKIRPRIFLEGNFFVDLHPGTPSAPVLSSGDTIKVTQTSDPVQLDQVLTALQGDTRRNLQELLGDLATGLDTPRHGQTAAQALNSAYDYIASSEQATSIVNDALLGQEPDRDLQRLLRGLADTTAGLDRNEVQLKDLISNFATTMGAFAGEQAALRSSIRELGPTLTAANGALGKLDAAFPATRAFAHEILPGVRATPGTIAAGFPWIAQTRKLLSRGELRGLAQNLSPASRDLARFVDASTTLLPQGDRLAKCVRDVILPTGDIQIKDQFATGQPNYREFFYSMVGLTGEGQNSDGNGNYVRFQAGGGTRAVTLGAAGEAGDALYGNGFAGGGTQPKRPPHAPPKVDTTPCYQSQIPDLNGPWATAGVAASQARASARPSTALAALRRDLRPFGTKR